MSSFGFAFLSAAGTCGGPASPTTMSMAPPSLTLAGSLVVYSHGTSQGHGPSKLPVRKSTRIGRLILTGRVSETLSGGGDCNVQQCEADGCDVGCIVEVGAAAVSAMADGMRCAGLFTVLVEIARASGGGGGGS